MLVVFQTSIAGEYWSFRKGKIVDLNNEQAKKWCASGVCMEFEDYVTNLRKSAQVATTEAPGKAETAVERAGRKPRK